MTSRSERGHCEVCGHSRVVPGTATCPRCEWRQLPIVRAVARYEVVQRRMRSHGPRHVPVEHEWVPYVRFRSAGITAADIGRPVLKCWICGGRHARIICPRERIASGWGGSTTPPREGGGGGISVNVHEEAHEFWKWLQLWKLRLVKTVSYHDR